MLLDEKYGLCNYDKHPGNYVVLNANKFALSLTLKKMKIYAVFFSI